MPSAELRIETFAELIYQRPITKEHRACATPPQNDG